MSLTLHPSAPARPPGAAVGRAWARYLRETREAAAAEYEAVEERAWARLVSNLRALGEELEDHTPASR